MSQTQVWVGLDIGLTQSAVCVIDELGSVLLQSKIDTDARAVTETLAEFSLGRIALVAMEIGSLATPLAHQLKALGYPVGVFETYQVSKFLALRRVKNDANDARGIAEIARLGRSTVSQVLLKNTEMQVLRSQLVLRTRLVRQRIMVQELVRSLIRLYGGKLRRFGRSAAFTAAAEAEVVRLASDLGVDIRDDVLPLLELEVAIKAQADRLTRKLTKTARHNPICRRFMTVPGVGPICAISFVTAVGEPERFRVPSAIGSYFGLVPSLRESGGTTRRGSITKAGNTLTRSHLLTSATVLQRGCRQESSLRSWGLALCDRIGRAKANVAVARKLAVLLLTLWQQDRDFEPFPVRSK